MTYQPDRNYEFPIVGGYNPADEFFLINVEGPNGPETVQFKKLPFQRREGYNATVIFGRVRGTDADTGLPIVVPDIVHYVYELYRDTFASEKPFICRVKNVPDNPVNEPYNIVDDNGIFFHLSEPQGLFTKGQQLVCRFTRLTPTSFSIALYNQPGHLQFITLDTILRETHLPATIQSFIRRFIAESPQLDQARREVACGNARWIVTAILAVMQHLPEWFLRADLRRKNKKFLSLLQAFRRIILYLLEDSGYLNATSGDQRRALQHQLTDIADNLDPYEETIGLIARQEENVFIERLLDHLRLSGYLYHPARRFAVLMLIFRLQPQKVAMYLSRIFESIFGRDIENWSCEPFRDAFLEQFQIYVNQARRDIDALPIAESRTAKTNLENIITAIALQLILAYDDTDTSRLWALFYRYVSLLRPLNTETLLTKAFLSLMGAAINNRLTYDELKQPMMMMTRATVMPQGDIFQRIQGTHRYYGNGVEIAINADGISIRQYGRQDITERAIPDGLMSWLNPQIYVNGARSLSGSRLRKLAEHNTWWHQIEAVLYHDETCKTVGNQKSRPTKGDEVYIVIDGIVDGMNTHTPTYSCHVQDDDYESVSGTIHHNQIVDYSVVHPSLHATRTETGAERGFLATVVTDEITDTEYRFSLRPVIDRYIDENFNYEDVYVAKIKATSDRDYSAISTQGLGLFLERRPDQPEFSKGDFVRFRYTHIGPQGTLKGAFVDYSDDMKDVFYTEDTVFERLLTAIGENGEPEDEEEFREESVDTFDLMPVETIREIIEIIRFKAISETDLIKAYDYLRFARILALAIEDSSLAEKLSAHAALLTLHQYFATNSRLDADKLAELAPVALADPFLKVIYHRLEIVSWLDRTEHNQDLYDTTVNPSSELEGAIASMVLAYNMIHKSQTDDSSSISNDIKSRIMQKLNVNNETRLGKYYGSESKYLEFKTSLVFPAGKPGEDCRESPKEQQQHILSRIAGFLNAAGGQLYIGVNNDGYEVGMAEDFRYYDRCRIPLFAGKHPHKVSDLDSLCVFLEDLVDQAFGHSTARKVSISSDDEATKGVIRIEIEQSLEPVFLDGRLYVRQSGQSTREYHGEDIDAFVREREELQAERQQALAINAETAVADITEVATPEATAVGTTDTTSLVPVADTAASNIIPTSTWRPNVLHDYNNDYIAPYGYLYFYDNDTITFSEEDKWLDPGQDDIRQILSVSHDMVGGYLILGYEGEKILRVPLEEIFRRGTNVSIPYNTDNRLIFAALARRDDAVLCIGADINDTLYRRAIRVNDLDMEHLKDSPRRFHEAPINHTVAYEIIDAKSFPAFADCSGDKLTNRRFGVSLRAKESAPGAAEKIHEVFLKCAPAN
ncbi:MAG: ATP-binding protein [Muribaculaceae bacterium]|nr:ATP-binding protein [Muribaculaceae bacterium]